jgi:hypothetical protein
MGFLKKFFRNVFREPAPNHTTSSFEMLSEEDLESHLKIARYGRFELTDAVRPSYDLQVVPRDGYRHDVYKEGEDGVSVPVIMASASREQLFDLFIDLLDPLGTNVDVVLETSHNRQGQGHVDLYREHIDLPVLKSTLYDYEDLLLNDGCCGLAVLNPGIPMEVQFDEHKLIFAYGRDLSAFEEVLSDYDISRDDEMKFITEAEHVHSSSEKYTEQFEELKTYLGMDGYA